MDADASVQCNGEGEVIGATWRLIGAFECLGQARAAFIRLPRRCQLLSLNRKVERQRICDLVDRRVEMSTSERSPKSPMGRIRFNKPAQNRAYPQKKILHHTINARARSIFSAA